MGTGELLGNLKNCGGVTWDGLASRPRGVETLLAPSCYRNRDTLCSYESVMAPRLHFKGAVVTKFPCLPVDEDTAGLVVRNKSAVFHSRHNISSLLPSFLP